MTNIDAVCVDLINTIAHDGCCAGPVPGAMQKCVSKPVKDILVSIGAEVPVIIVTGRPWANASWMLPDPRMFHAVTEHGGALLKNGDLDVDHIYRLKMYREGSRPYQPGEVPGWLWQYRVDLEKKGLQTEWNDRYISFTVRARGWDLETRYAFTTEQHPHDMKAVMHENDIDVIPPEVSKRNGVDYMLRKLGIPWERVAYLGDDNTDNAMLLKAGYPVTHAVADAATKATVRQRKGYIAATGSHKGALEMLEYVKGLVKPGLV